MDNLLKRQPERMFRPETEQISRVGTTNVMLFTNMLVRETERR
jgi:hypothetical protein